MKKSPSTIMARKKAVANKIVRRASSRLAGKNPTTTETSKGSSSKERKVNGFGLSFKKKFTVKFDHFFEFV
jgi:hypothetical protein